MSNQEKMDKTEGLLKEMSADTQAILEAIKRKQVWRDKQKAALLEIHELKKVVKASKSRILDLENTVLQLDRNIQANEEES